MQESPSGKAAKRQSDKAIGERSRTATESNGCDWFRLRRDLLYTAAAVAFDNDG
jgi:hypothetical protein